MNFPEGMKSVEDGYVHDPPERDIGPDTSRNVILRDLRQMANDFTKTNLTMEMNKMKKLENIYAISENPDVGSTLRDVETYKARIKEKKMVLDELAKTSGKIQFNKQKKGPLAITDGRGADRGDVSIDQELKEMEQRIIEAKEAVSVNGMDRGILDALNNYHEVFKQSMESMENLTRSRSNKPSPKINLRTFIDDAEKCMIMDGQQDAEVAKALNELKHLNKYDTFAPNKLPFIPDLPYNYKEEIAQLDLMSNDMLEQIGVKEDLVEMPLTKFLENSPQPKPAKSIMKKVEEAEKRKALKAKYKKECKNKVRFQGEVRK